MRAIAKFSGPDPWQQIESATARERTLYLPYTFIEGAAGFNSILFRYARLILRGADERLKPNTVRLREFTDSSLPRIEQQLYAPRADLRRRRDDDAVLLAAAHARMAGIRIIRWCSALLEKESPDALADQAGRGNKARRSRGAQAAVAGRQGRGGRIARSDVGVRALARRRIALDSPVNSKMKSRRPSPPRRKKSPLRASRRSAPVSIPDATFTLRLNYGKVQGWTESGKPVEPLHPTRPGIRTGDRLVAVQDSRQLDGGQGAARYAHAVLHRHQQRHRRRQFRQPVDRFTGQNRRAACSTATSIPYRETTGSTPHGIGRSRCIPRSFARRSTRCTAQNHY